MMSHYTSRLGLNKVVEREHEDPHQVHKVPIQAHLLDHFIVSASLIEAGDCIKVDQEVQQYSAEHVEAVKARYEKEEVSKILRPVLIHTKTRSCYRHLLPDTFGVIEYIFHRRHISTNNKVRPLPSLA